ncbi:MAG TPA: hypothetical protein VMT93_04685 [Gemmatimonadaceae bacterium]|nr:hypothetical protein [Gemmatimonadaceae bacterium]
MESPTGRARRILTARETWWAVGLTRTLQRWGVRPLVMALLAALFAMLAGIAFYNVPYSGRPEVWWAAGALGIQIRLLFELLGGMLMVTGMARSRLDAFFAEGLATFSDAVVLVGVGYSVDIFLPGGADLGWCAALLAVFCEYVRVIGGSLGLPQLFTGPFGRQPRMYVITFGAIAAGVQNAIFRPGWAMVPALLIVVIGTAWTISRRAEGIVRQLKA